MDTFTYVVRDLISGANATGTILINVTTCAPVPYGAGVNATDDRFVLTSCAGAVNFTRATLTENDVAPPAEGALDVTGVTAVTPPVAGTLTGPNQDGVYTFTASGSYEGGCPAAAGRSAPFFRPMCAP